MDRDSAQNIVKNFDVIKAFSEGKTVQHRRNESFPWVVGKDYTFMDDPSCYRVRPEPIELDVWYRARPGQPPEVYHGKQLNESDGYLEGHGFVKMKMRQVVD